MAKPKEATVLGEIEAADCPGIHFTVGRAPLLRELATVSGAVERKSTIPVLSKLRLLVKGGRLFTASTNLDMSMETRCDVNAMLEGGLCLSAEKLTSIVKLAEDGEIEFKSEKEKNRVTIKTGRSRFSLPIEPVGSFPQVEKVNGMSIEIPVNSLRAVSTAGLFAVTKQESRYNLSGGKLEIENNLVRVVTTDGHRMVVVESSVENNGEFKADALVPASCLKQIGHMLDGANENEKATLTINKAQIGITVSNKQMVSRLLTGDFPAWKMLMQRDDHKYSASVSAIDLLGTLRRVSLMVDENIHALRFEFDGSNLLVTAPESELGGASERLGLEYSGVPNLVLSFNSSYFEDALEAVRKLRGADAGITIHIKDEKSHAEIRPTTGTNGDTDFRCVLMPMRL